MPAPSSRRLIEEGEKDEHSVEVGEKRGFDMERETNCPMVEKMGIHDWKSPNRGDTTLTCRQCERKIGFEKLSVKRLLTIATEIEDQKDSSQARRFLYAVVDALRCVEMGVVPGRLFGMFSSRDQSIQRRLNERYKAGLKAHEQFPIEEVCLVSLIKWHHTDPKKLEIVEQLFMNGKPRPNFPPIAVGRVGSELFLIDGHHRVKIAERLGLMTLQAQIVTLSEMKREE